MQSGVQQEIRVYQQTFSVSFVHNLNAFSTTIQTTNLSELKMTLQKDEIPPSSTSCSIFLDLDETDEAIV